MNHTVRKLIIDYQRKCWTTYKEEVGISKDYCYLNGNLVKVHVPVDTACEGIMIIGAYPTAHFNVIGRERDVPVGDHLYPFSNEKYFDGSRIRVVDSGRELEELFLNPLGLKREDTWITDLVKVFLFKTGHKNKYERLGFKGAVVNRSEFNKLARASLPFIYEEISICKPKLILGLGSEVNSILLNESMAKATDTIRLTENRLLKVEDVEYNYIACPHPGILMRENNETGKWKNVLRVIIENINSEL